MSHQTENGYTRIADSLLDAIMLAGLSKRELLIVLCVIRFTYGFRRKSHLLTASFIAAATGIPRQHAAGTISAMVQRGILTRKRTQGGNHLGLRKAFFPSPETVTTGSPDSGTTETPASPDSGTSDVTGSGTTDVTESGHKKDRSTNKSTDNAQLPPNLDPATWSDWQQHRREIRKKLTPTTTSRQLAMLAKQPDPNACITQSIEAGWTGLFPVKLNGAHHHGKPNGTGHRGQRTTQDILDDALAALDGEAAPGGYGETVGADGRPVR
jgi:phage replication O-like protein O